MTPFKYERVIIFSLPNGSEPLTEWLRELDPFTRARVQKRIQRIEAGNLGDQHHVVDDIYEFRLDFGPGYRLYWFRDGATVVLLLGGDKGTQSRDIRKAQSYRTQMHSDR